MLNIVGLGLSLKDISVKGIEAINKSDEVYIESYLGRGSKVKGKN